MTVDIYIREKSGTREIRIPLLPEDFTFSNGDVIFVTSEIMGLGEVSVPDGTELGTYSWESEFPGELRKHDSMLRGSWQSPQTYRSLLEEWKQEGTELNLLITGYPVNVDVYCKEFKPKGVGAFGDIAYEITFVQARKITVSTMTVETPERPTTSQKTYTIKSGDTLWGIAQAHYGSGAKWTIIYEANKEIIEQTARNHGKRSSNNGHWIYPGVTLVIPDISSNNDSNQNSKGDSRKNSTKSHNANYKKQRDSAMEGYAKKHGRK